MREQTYAAPEELWTALGNWGLQLAHCVDCGGGWAETEVCWNAIWARSTASLRAGLFLPLPYLMEAFGLEPFARKCLILAVLPETDRRFETLYAALSPGGQGALTADLALRLCDCAPTAACLRTLSPDGALLCSCMEERGFAGQSELSRILKPAQRILSFLLQGAWEEPGVPGLTLWQPEGESSLPLTVQLQRYLAETPAGETAVFELCGQSGAGRRTLVRDFAAGQNQPVLFVEGRYLLGEGGMEFRRSLLRETVLQQCAVCCGGLDTVLEAAKTEPEAERFLTELLVDLAATTPICFLLSAEEWLPEVQGETWRVLPIPLPLPDLEESRGLWAALFTRYPVAEGIDPDELAGKYRFTPGQMRRAIEEAASLARWDGRQKIDSATLNRGCRRQLRHALGEKAQKVETIFTWEDLILPDFPKKLLASACDQMKHRRQVYGAWGFSRKLAYGTGLSMLFSGPPGTGKTMAAQIVAGELQLELYKVDLAAVVSKYVGETEKNLGAIFREAARGQTLLFFDEADVLFGKRTEVKDSH
ncbi:MAG: ATP-binding protein, partial [Oscillospiraceae bacterium]